MEGSSYRNQSQPQVKGSPYLEQLDPNACKHELEQGGDNHDVADGSDGHKDTLDNVLGRENRESMEGCYPSLNRSFSHKSTPGSFYAWVPPDMRI